jgi:hypothetical protein
MFLADIEAFDSEPRVSGVYMKFLCNQPACAGKPQDALHKSLSVNAETGVWHCFRCSAHGVLEDDIFDEPAEFAPREQYGNAKQAARQRMKSKFDVAGPE